MNRAKPYGTAWAKAMKLYARQNGIKGYGMAILDVLIDCRDYTTGQSHPGRKHIRELTGATRNTVHLWLSTMRNDGIIIPLAYLNGGHACATCYGFPVPAWTHSSQVVGGIILPKSTPPKNDNYPPNNRASTPPKNGEATVLNNIEQGKGINETPRRGQGHKVDDTNRVEEMRLLGQWTDQYGFAEARHMLEAWKLEGTA